MAGHGAGFRVRTLMALTACAAVALGIGFEVDRLARLSKHYRRVSQACFNAVRGYREVEALYEGELLALEAWRRGRSPSPPALKLLRGVPPGRESEYGLSGVLGNRELAERYTRLGRFYRQAARRPWRRVPREIEREVADRWYEDDVAW